MLWLWTSLQIQHRTYFTQKEMSMNTNIQQRVLPTVILNVYDRFTVCAIMVHILIPHHSFCFRKTYDVLFLGTLERGCRFFLFKFISIPTVNTYVFCIAPFLISTLACGGKAGMLFLMHTFVWDVVWNT